MSYSKPEIKKNINLGDFIGLFKCATEKSKTKRNIKSTFEASRI